MQRLALRRGTVLAVDGTQLTVEVDGEERPAVAYEELTGPNEVGDEVVVNVANGTAHNHEPDEFVTVEALESALDVALTLVECSGSR